MSFRRILIANRGEIALRVQAACRARGVAAVQAYSEADADSRPVREADDAICLGGPKVAESYGNPSRVIEAAQKMDCDAIHPGYGFLSENAAFAEACADAGIVFIGPQADIIRRMGDKAEARRIAVEAGVPVIPGTDGPVDPSRGAEEAARIGFPLLIKAAAGGGGRGMRVVEGPEAFDSAFESASREAEASFGSGAMYLERYLEKVRHIEVQVFGDGERFVHLGERDCSTQRRHQKLVEEAPAAGLDPDQAEAIRQAALALARAVRYRNAGTVEFVVDMKTGEFFFIEMNTRIQVEHPVTEAVTGLDLVAEQIVIAEGAALSWRQDDIRISGHAIECRVNAEDPAKGFMPRPGTVTDYGEPKVTGLRIDTHLEDGYALPPHYDSMLAKVVIHADSREEAIARMKQALERYRIEGQVTTIPFLLEVMDDPAFRAADMHTRYVREVMYDGRPMQKML